ncbi:MAG: septum formation initiator family protein [Lactobacillales bacterium]|jgi:cell division protein DivIC|nr:septum formation initiator family protein [Lactobacillales bacterium]
MKKKTLIFSDQEVKALKHLRGQRRKKNATKYCVVLAAIVIIFATFGVINGNLHKIKELKVQAAQEASAAKESNQLKKQLDQEIEELADPEFAGKVARAKLFYSKDGEVLYSIPDELLNKMLNPTNKIPNEGK